MPRKMPRKLLVIQGHPDPGGGHYCHALADAYIRAAEEAGHQVQKLDVARLEVPPLHNQDQWTNAESSHDMQRAQALVSDASHLVLIYPLWLGDVPASLKAFLEQLFRPGFAIDTGGATGWKRKLKGRTATIVVTMGMPALVYRLVYRAHSLKSLRRNILSFVGIRPVRSLVIGTVESGVLRRLWLTRMSRLGARGG